MVCCAEIEMFKFRGFKASFNLLSGRKKSKDQYEKPSDIPVLGAYRGYSEDYFGSNVYNRQPSSTKPNMSEPNNGMKASKSTSDLPRQKDRAKDARKSTSDIPLDITEQKNGKGTKLCEREQRKFEKQKSEEHKRRDRSKSRDQPEIIRREKNDQAQHRLSKEVIPKRERKKTPAPQPPTAANTSRTSTNYSTGTLESSISRSSGPPPYSEEAIPNQNDNTGNTSFGKPVETSSWDLVTQHRQQLSKPIRKSKAKATVLDLGYHTESRVELGRDKNAV